MNDSMRNAMYQIRHARTNRMITTAAAAAKAAAAAPAAVLALGTETGNLHPVLHGYGTSF